MSNFLRLLFIGDIDDLPGKRIIQKELKKIKEKFNIDLVVANGENVTNGLGINLEDAKDLLDSGIDVLTLGNHTWVQKDIEEVLKLDKVIRPANFDADKNGKGYIVIEKRGKKIGILNLLGREVLYDIFGKPQIRVDIDPFKTALEIFEKEKNVDIWIVDFHGESEIEKKSFAYWVDGKVALVVGTHTHVQTADQTILPKGTAYITDVGMTGVMDSIVGVKPEQFVKQFVENKPTKLEGVQEGDVAINAILVDIDLSSNKPKKIRRFVWNEDLRKRLEYEKTESLDAIYEKLATLHKEKLVKEYLSMISKIKDFKEFYKITGDFTKKLLEIDGFVLAVYREDIDRLEIRYRANLDIEDEKLANIKKFLRDSDIEKIVEEFEGCYIYKIVTDNKLLGVFITKEKIEDEFFLEFIKYVAFEWHKLLLYAINNQKIEELEVIYKVVKSIGSNLELDTLISNIMKETKEVLDSEASSVLLVDEKTGDLYFKVVEGGSEKVKEIRVPKGKGIAGYVADTGESVVVPDTSKDPRFFGQADKKSGFVTKSIIAVPLKYNNEVIGVLEVLNRKGDIPYGQHDLEMLQLIASQAAGMIANSKLYEKIKQMYYDMIKVLAKAMDARDPYTHGHSERVAMYSVMIARQLGWSKEDIDRLEKAALLHDIGKIGVEDRILRKPGRLTDEEYKQIQRHPVISAEILEVFDMFKDIIPWIKHHHERWDGRGYPDKLEKENIPIGARLIAVADTFDAMTSHRAYRRGLPIEIAEEEIERCKGAQFDPVMADAFLAVLKDEKIRQEIKDIIASSEPQDIYGGGKVNVEDLPKMGTFSNK